MKTVYSIVYAINSPSIGDRISLGLVIIGKEKSSFFYSPQKLEAAATLFGGKSGEFLKKSIYNFSNSVLHNADKEQVMKKIRYLSRYSNNLIGMTSPIEMGLDYNDNIPAWLFQRHVGEANTMTLQQ